MTDDRIIVEGGHPLYGEVTIHGAKNAVLPILSASLLLPERLYYMLMQYERYIFLAMVLILFSGVFSKPLGICVQYVMYFLIRITDVIEILL